MSIKKGDLTARSSAQQDVKDCGVKKKKKKNHTHTSYHELSHKLNIYKSQGR